MAIQRRTPDVPRPWKAVGTIAERIVGAIRRQNFSAPETGRVDPGRPRRFAIDGRTGSVGRVEGRNGIEPDDPGVRTEQRRANVVGEVPGREPGAVRIAVDFDQIDPAAGRRHGRHGRSERGGAHAGDDLAPVHAATAELRGAGATGPSGERRAIRIAARMPSLTR